MRTLQRKINLAIRDGLFLQSEYPLENLALHRERTEKTHFTLGGIKGLPDLMQNINGGMLNLDSESLPAPSLRALLLAIYRLGIAGATFRA
jgi:hypothetical protein